MAMGRHAVGVRASASPLTGLHNSVIQAASYCSKLGFEPLAYKGLETGSGSGEPCGQARAGESPL